MAKFSEWCQSTEKEINKQTLHRLTAQPENIDKGVENTTQVVPEHYASPSRLAGVLRILGKEGVAKLLEEKLPRTAQIRSGDLGEILATEYIDEKTEFHAPIKRLRWKDHREMAMRGEDVIGVVLPRFVGHLVKSR